MYFFKIIISQASYLYLYLLDACVDPLIRVRGQLLKRNKLVDNLNNKLRKRPGPLELVNRKILQVDAELEQAIQGKSSLETVSRDMNESIFRGSITLYTNAIIK